MPLLPLALSKLIRSLIARTGSCALASPNRLHSASTHKQLLLSVQCRFCKHLKAHSHESESYPDSRNVHQILLPANPDLIRIPFTCANERRFRCNPCTMDSIHLHEIQGRIQAITTLPVVVSDFSILRSQVLDLGLTLPPRTHNRYPSNYERLLHRLYGFC